MHQSVHGSGWIACSTNSSTTARSGVSSTLTITEPTSSGSKAWLRSAYQFDLSKNGVSTVPGMMFVTFTL